MTYDPAKFTDENVEKAFAHLAGDAHWEYVRYAILSRYADVRKLFLSTEPNTVNRAVGKMEELEWMLERFGEPLYGGLPLADGISAGETASTGLDLASEIGGGYPGGSGSRPPL